MTSPKLTLCGGAASRFAGPAFGCPSVFGLVFAAPRATQGPLRDPWGAGLLWGGPAGGLT